MKDLDDFLPLIQPFAVAAPEPRMTRCLVDAAIRFCEATRLWKGSDDFATSGAYPEQLSVPDGATLYEIEACSLDGRPLTPVTLRWMTRERPGWRTESVGSSSARWYVCPEIGTVQPVPRSAGALSVDFSLKPTPDAATLPDLLYDLYAETIAEGAVARVLLTPAATYANPQVGSALYASFEQKLDRLFAAGERGQQAAPIRSRANFF